MQPQTTTTPASEGDSRTDRSMLVLQYAIALAAASAAGLLALLH